jgi:hypothetical protein
VSLILSKGFLLFQQKAAWEKMATSSDTWRRGTLLGTWLLLVEVSETPIFFMLVHTGCLWNTHYCWGRVLNTRTMQQSCQHRSLCASSFSYDSFCVAREGGRRTSVDLRLWYYSFCAVSIINSQYSVQQNAPYCSQIFLSQYHVERCYVFRSLMASSSGNYIKVTMWFPDDDPIRDRNM